MRRSVAGRAGGRSPARGSGRRGTPTAVLRAAVLAVAAVAGLAGTVGAAPGSAAVPGTASPSGGTSPTEHPVQIEVSRFEPRTLNPTAVITISGTLRNTGDAAVSHLALRLQRGAVYGTRAELAAADRDPDPDTEVVASFAPVPGQLQPGGSLSFTYMLPASQMRLDVAGVYPALLNANGTIQGTERRVGQLNTYLVQPPSTPTARTTVSWIWPLTERTHRNAAGRFTDDGLARAVASSGRLDRALATVERLPRATPAGGSQAVPTVPVTLAIDPALVEELQIMAAGPYRVGNADGKGTQAAASFLQRLKSLAGVVPVVALPYGDVDAEALASAGLSDVVTRSLPSTSQATARDTRFTGQAASSPGGEPNGTEAGAGAQILSAALGMHPRTDLAWLPSGAVRPETLAGLQKDGVAQAVLPSTTLTGGDANLGLGPATAAAATTVPTTTGSLPALVGDARLGGLADAGSVAGGPRIGEQRYLAELTLVSLQAPVTGTAPSVLVTPPRGVDADPDAVAAMMTDTVLPWMQPGTLASLSSSPTAGTLVAPSATPSLDPEGLQTLTAADAVRNAVAGAAVRDAAATLAPADAALSRAASIAWRNDAAGFRGAARDVRTVVTQFADQVTLVAPANGTYSLASSGAPLVLTVRNDLPFAVQVLLSLGTPTSGLQLGDIGRQTLLPGQRTTLQVPTQVHRLGAFTVTAALTTPDGKPLGDPVQIRVKTTAYGPIGLIITIGAALLLGLLFLRRLIRFLLRRRGGPPESGLPGPAPEGAAVPLPPTRSPV